MRISYWSSDVCSSDLVRLSPRQRRLHPYAAQADRPRRPGTLSARRADAARRRLIVADSEDPPVDGGAAGDGAAARRAQGPRSDGVERPGGQPGEPLMGFDEGAIAIGEYKMGGPGCIVGG